mmetsp:Transcript_36951/g.87312  ORF Transcript_36951/g.87312 Transcript_36951/m.87312 type:complete len:780 (-) Transcript_36951:56-2395(-)
MFFQTKGSLVAFALLSTLVLQCSSAPILHHGRALSQADPAIAAYDYMGAKTDGCDCCLWLCDETAGYYFYNNTCIQCPSGHYRSGGNCLECKTCDGGNKGGRRTVTACSATADTVCGLCQYNVAADCPSGTYFVDNSTVGVCPTCMTHTACTESQYLVTAGTNAADAVCTSCPTCNEGQTLDAACTATTASTCKNCAGCSCTGATYCVPCTGTADTTCTAPTCVDGTSNAGNGVVWKNGNASTTCDTTTCAGNSCSAGNTYVSTPCTTTKTGSGATEEWRGVPEVCTDCSDPTCTAQQWKKACTVTSDTACMAITSCVEDSTYIFAVATASSDTVCTACREVCEVGTDGTDGSIIIAGSCNATTLPSAVPNGNTQCKSCATFTDSTCNLTQGKYIKTCDGASVDTTCETCPTCSGSNYYSTVCALNTPSACTACSTCAIGMYQTAACTMGTHLSLGSNTVCSMCTNKPTAVIINGYGGAVSTDDEYYAVANPDVSNAGWEYTTNGGTSATGCGWQCSVGYYKVGTTCVKCLDGTTTPVAGATSAAQCNVTLSGLAGDFAAQSCTNIPLGAKTVTATGGTLQCTLFSDVGGTAACSRCITSCPTGQALLGSCGAGVGQEPRCIEASANDPIVVKFNARLAVTLANFGVGSTARTNYIDAVANSTGVSTSDVAITGTSEVAARRAAHVVLEVSTEVTTTVANQATVTSGVTSNLGTQLAARSITLSSLGPISAAVPVVVVTTPTGGTPDTTPPTISAASGLLPVRWLMAAVLALLSAKHLH